MTFSPKSVVPWMKSSNTSIMLVFDDFIQGTTDFGEKVMPLLKCRQ